MSRSEQSERPGEIVSARCDASNPEKAGELTACDTSCSNDRESRRGNGSKYHGDESFFCFAGVVGRFAPRASSNFQNFRRGDAFGIREIGGRYEVPSQR